MRYIVIIALLSTHTLLLFPPSLMARLMAKRTAIARFDVVPHQIVNSPFEVGLLAFHKDGIENVSFDVSDGTKNMNYIVSMPSLNPRTHVEEYWFTLDPLLFQDGLITITATATPSTLDIDNGRRTIVLELYCNGNGSLCPPLSVYVGTEGSDTNQGTLNSPMGTILGALYTLKENCGGGEIILKDEGTYYLGTADNNRSPKKTSHWITIRAADGLDRDKVILTNEERSIVQLNTKMVHWKNVSLDFKNIIQIYNFGSHDWFDNCRWFNSDGRSMEYSKQLINVRDYYYATDSIAHDMLYGFHFCKLLRNSKILRISGDAIQMNLLSINTEIDDIDGSILKHHSDVYQMWDQMDNIIVYNLETRNLVNTQSIFLQPVNNVPKDEPVVALSNAAFVNCSFDNKPAGSIQNTNGPPFSQMQSSFQHIIFRNVSLPWQRFILRTELTGNKAWSSSDVIFEDCELHFITYNNYVNQNSSQYLGAPPGVSFINCSSAPAFRPLSQ